MGLFGFGKKEEKKEAKCCCGGETNAEEQSTCCCGEGGDGAEKNGCCCACGGEGCNIKVLGAGCKLCHEQYENVKAAVAGMKLDASVEYITDMEVVMTYGVMTMPAIVVNEKVVSSGKVLKTEEVEKLLKNLGC